ncbi:LuxR family transcriptional regulator [Pseudonocardia sp.]|uniref:ATP-binding protein n=1 Tax=Pseudonocardia sp. TaxID=60912 RepID=UPI00261A8A72|nr:LuxR family transcriptional regulator [Pseudonocardia sp.]
MTGRVRAALVGRDVEWRELDGALQRSVAGGFGCVLLVGDPGVGKTRLAGQFVAEQGDALAVLTARAYHLGSTTAFGVWAEALDGALRARPREEVRRLCAGIEPELAGLLRSVATLGDRGDRAPRVEPPRTRLLDALAVLLRALAAQRPVVLVVDDLHLADSSSLEALHYLAHHCADQPVLVIGTARPVELAEHGVAVEVLVRLEQDGLARRLAVGPLEQSALGELAASVLGDPPPETLVTWLADRTRGNPLDAIGLLHALVEEGADLHRPALRRLPEALSDRVALRLRGLDAVAGTIVELLSVIGRRADLRSLVALSGRPPAELVAGIEHLVRARLVGEDDRGSDVTVEISHPLVADAVYQRMSAARRHLLHREVGRVLRSMGRLGEAAGHFARSAGPGDDEAVTVLRTAVHAAERAGAFQEALTVLGALVPLLPAGDPRWVEVVDALSWDAQWVVDHRADNHAAKGVPALRAMDAALAALDDPGRRAPVKLRLATFLGWGDGDVAEAAQICAEARDLFARAGDRRGALLAAHELAWLHGVTGDVAGLDTEARAVAEEATRCGDAVVRSRAVRTLGQVALWRCRPAEAQAAFDELAATSGGDPNLLFLAAAGRAMTAISADRVEEGLTALDAITAAAPGNAADYDAMFSLHAGLITRALAVARDVSGIGPMPATRRVGLGLGGAAMAAVEAGRFADARRWSGRLRALGWGLHTRFADHVDALLAWRDGRPDDACALLRRVAAATVAGDHLVAAVAALGDLAEIAARSGTPEPAAADALAQIAGRTGLGSHRALADLAAAWCTRDGDLARVAADTLTDRPLLRGRALVLVARSTGERDQAVEALTEAAALFEGCGAVLRRTGALDELAALGTRGKRAAAAALGPSSLTAREREVAQLAVDGLSAREIGAALFIGERTVEGHLARAYARLGVRSKLELTRRAAELGLRTPGTRTSARTSTPDPQRAGS